jgi:RNA recognition motif. (a.k.a. RRM, RBD, or RNP domain)
MNLRARSKAKNFCSGFRRTGSGSAILVVASFNTGTEAIPVLCSICFLLQEMLEEFGEIDDLFYNATKHFCFVKYDFKSNAEKCKSRLGKYTVKQ